jgi:uncharacterized membrane-anchored protein YitT (DUF2179 family)
MNSKVYALTQNKVVRVVGLVTMAFFLALDFEIFIYRNAFAPTGVAGIGTLVQHLFAIPVGFTSLLINIPMLIFTYLRVDKKYAVGSLIFTIAFSAFGILFSQMDLSAICYEAKDTGGKILASVAGSFFNGLIYAVSIKLGGSTGGTDVIGMCVNYKKPEYDTVWLIFGFNAVIAGISFFVYGMDYQAVILCIIYNFVTGRVSDSVIKGARAAAKFEVVTTHPEELAQELMAAMHHGCTVIPARGMYSHTDKSVLFCVVNRREVVDFEKIVRKYDDTFAFISTVNGTVGKFDYESRRRKKKE